MAFLLPEKEIWLTAVSTRELTKSYAELQIHSMEASFWRGHLIALVPAHVTRNLSLVFRIAILRPKKGVGILEKNISTEKI
jgi:hypothetical protein